MILASCSYEEAKKYNSKLVLVSEKENNKKPEEVILNIVTDNPNEVFVGGKGVAKCVTTSVSPTYCPNDLKGNIFRTFNYGEDISRCEEEIEGVTPMLVLPKGFSDMKEIYSLSLKYPRLRFIGGNILEIPGIKIGRYDKGKEKMSAVFNGVYDMFSEVRLEDIVVQRVLSKSKSKSSGGSKKPSIGKSKKTDSFSKFFGGEGDAF